MGAQVKFQAKLMTSQVTVQQLRCSSNFKRRYQISNCWYEHLKRGIDIAVKTVVENIRLNQLMISKQLNKLVLSLLYYCW